MVRPKIPDMDPDKRARLDKIYEQRKQCEKRKELAARTVESSEKSVDPCLTDIFSILIVTKS